MLRRVLLASLLCLAGPALAQEDGPLVLLLDGLGVYVENNYVGVSALARPLRQQGFRTVTDTHFLTREANVVPDVIIGHSLGGSTALTFARDLVKKGQPAPLVITIDAAPGSPACPVARCINIHGPTFPDVRRAENIDAWGAGARFVSHAQLPLNPIVEQIILDRTSTYLTQWRAARLPEAGAAATGAKGG